jgi:hypothetical protein
MKRLLVLTVAVLALTLTANRASAGGWWIGEAWPGWYVTYTPQTVTYWQPERFYREVETEVDVPTYKTVTRTLKVTVLEEDFREEEHVGTFWVWVPRTFEVEVERTRSKRVQMVEKPSGNVFWVSVPEVYTEKIPQVRMEHVKEMRKWTDRVPYFKPVEKVYEQDVVVIEVERKKVMVLQRVTRLVPYETSLLVPVYVPGAVPRPHP